MYGYLGSLASSSILLPPAVFPRSHWPPLAAGVASTQLGSPMSLSPSPASPASTHSSDLEGHIELVFGPMFSGKTTELMRRIRRYTHAKKRCQVIKYSKDTRYDDTCASTHDLQKCEARGASQLSELSEESLEPLDVIGIDEGQFFPDVVEFSDRWASRGKVVIVAALDATFERKPFRTIELVPLAETVVKLNAVCMMCHRDASFTRRIGSETAVEVIGGADKYLSTCRRCFHAPLETTNESTNASAVSSPVAASQAGSPVMMAHGALSLADSPVPIAPLHSETESDSPAVKSTHSLANSKRIMPSPTEPLRVIDTNSHVGEESIVRKRKFVLPESDCESKRPQLEKEQINAAVC